MNPVEWSGTNIMYLSMGNNVDRTKETQNGWHILYINYIYL